MSIASERPSAIAIAVAGCVALAVAMGIGRFAFTPILPMMLHDGAVDLHAASWLASANYLGYLSGALLCTFAAAALGAPAAAAADRRPGAGSRRPGRHRRAHARDGAAVAGGLAGAALPGRRRQRDGVRVRLGLVPDAARAARPRRARRRDVRRAGRRHRRERPAGERAGRGGRTSAPAWLVFGVLACVLTASVWRIFHTRAAATRVPRRRRAGAAKDRDAAPPRDASPRHDARTRTAKSPTLAFAYGISGFGYIVTATFLPVIARAALPADSPWLDLFWPIFGAGVILGAVLATRVRVSGDLRIVLAGAYLVQAVAIAIGLALPTAAGFALGSFLLGLPFTALTYFALQEVRRLRPHQVAATTGLVTALWSIGQIGRTADGRRAAAANDRRRRGVHALAGDRRRRARRRRGRVPRLVARLAEAQSPAE